MPENQTQQVLETRKQIEEQQRQLEQAKREVTPEKRVAYTPRKQREELRVYRKGLTTTEQQIAKQQREFEIQVARAGLAVAKPEVLEQQYREATSKIQSKINLRERDIKDYENTIKELEQERREARDSKSKQRIKERIKDYENDIKELKAELRGYKEGLSGGKSAVVKKYYSGQTSAMADYYKDKESAKQRNKELRKQYEAQLEQAKQKTEQTYKQYGLNPVYDTKGNIRGFEDVKAQVSYRIEELGNIRPEILPQLKQAGVIDYTEGKVSYEKPELGYKDIFTGEMVSIPPELAQASGSKHLEGMLQLQFLL